MSALSGNATVAGSWYAPLHSRTRARTPIRRSMSAALRRRYDWITMPTLVAVHAVAGPSRTGRACAGCARCSPCRSARRCRAPAPGRGCRRMFSTHSAVVEVEAELRQLDGHVAVAAARRRSAPASGPPWPPRPGASLGLRDALTEQVELAAMPRPFSSRTAATAESMVSPATKREASVLRQPVAADEGEDPRLFAEIEEGAAQHAKVYRCEG